MTKPPSGPKRRRAFRDNYLAALGVAVLVLFSFCSQAQIFTKPNNSWGTIVNRWSPDSTLYIPTFCGVPTDSTWLFSKGFGNGQILKKAALYFDTCGHNMYVWEPVLKQWLTITTTAAAPLSITTQPLSQTAFVGDNVTFTVVATGGVTPYTYQWFKNIVSIPGATSSSLNLVGISTGDAGNYNCVVQDVASGSAISNTAVLTVNTPITVTYAYSSTDPYVDDFTAPTAGTTATTNITHNADLSITFPFAAENKFLWFKVPSGESMKVTWFVSSLNNGSIPDVAFRAAFTVGGFTYYVTRDPAGFAFDSSLPVQLKQ